MAHEAENAGNARVPAMVFDDGRTAKSLRSASTALVATEAVPHLDRMALRVTKDISSVESDWRALEALPGNSLHQGYDWCRAWASAHQSDLLIVTGDIDGLCVMLLPLEIIRQQGVRTASYLGQGHNNLNTGLFSDTFPQLDAGDLALFQQRLRKTLSGEADLLLLETTPRIWRDFTHPLATLTAIENPNHTFQLQLHRSFEATLAQLNAKRRRKKFRVQTRRLDELGGYDHVCPTTVEGQLELLEIFFRQKGQRLRALGLPDVFAPEEIRVFFRRLLQTDTTAENYPLRLHAISLKGEHAGRIVAIAGLSRKGDHIICQFGSIDDTIAPETSPGELLFWLMIEEACREGAALFDFGRGDQLYKRSWCNIETVTHDLMIALTWRGFVAMQAHMALAKAKGAIKRNPAIYRFIQRLRARGVAPATTAEAPD